MWTRMLMKALLPAVLLVAPAISFADPMNPDFEDALNHWMVDGLVSPQSDGQGGYALFQEFQTQQGPDSATLYQDFILPSMTRKMSFEYILLTEGTFVGTGALPDAFTMRLLNATTLVPLLSISGFDELFYHDTRGASDSLDDSAVDLSSIASRAGWSTVSFDVSSLAAGTKVRLQFDLFGTGLLDGQLTFAGVDNLSLTRTPPIPAPSAAVLGLIGMVSLLRRRATSR